MSQLDPISQALALKMVRDQLSARGIKDQAVLAVMLDLPRHLFVPHLPVSDAYADKALPTAGGQTISQPYMVALMSQLLEVKPNHKILEIGTGSGYQTAILARLSVPPNKLAAPANRPAEPPNRPPATPANKPQITRPQTISSHILSPRIITIERSQHLADFARKMLTELNLDHIVEFVVGDGTVGWPANRGDGRTKSPAPYDRILVTAGAPAVPTALKEQLADPGRIVIPIGDRKNQQLIVYKLLDGQWQTEQSVNCRFVPLIGKQGWEK